MEPNLLYKPPTIISVWSTLRQFTLLYSFQAKLMASLMTPRTDQAYITSDTAMAQIGTLSTPTHSLSAPSPATQTTPLMDSLTVLNSEPPGGHAVGGAKDGGVMSLSHVLSGLQGEGDLAEVLQEQPNLSHGECMCNTCTRSSLSSSFNVLLSLEG